MLPKSLFDPQTVPPVPCWRSIKLYVAIVQRSINATPILQTNIGPPSGVTNCLIITTDFQCVHPPIGLTSMMMSTFGAPPTLLSITRQSSGKRE
jgi:hypothetical protein